MSNPSHLISAAFNTPNLRRKSIRRRAYVGLLVAATSATVLWSGGAAHSGPCAVQIARLDGQIRQAPSPENGPTAPQSVAGQLHHQPTPETVLNAERKAKFGKPPEHRLDTNIRPCQMRWRLGIVLTKSGNGIIEILRLATGRL